MFYTPLVFDALVRGFPSNYCLPVWFEITRMMGLPDGEKISDDMFTRFDRMYERDRQIHRQTDGHRMTAKAALDTSIARQKLCDPYLSALSVMYYNKGALYVHLPLSGCEKIAIFDHYFSLSRKRYKIGLRLLWNVNRNPYPSY